MRLLSYLPAWFDPILPPDLDDRPKIFGIGFHKTGTTSLGRALRSLGFRVQKGFSFNVPGKRVQIAEPVTLDKIRQIAFEMVPYYTAFEDNPWPLLFRELDERFPGSRFILTVRDPDRWFRSAVNFHQDRLSSMHDLIYEHDQFRFAQNKTMAIERFNRHNDEVRRHFKDRSGDLLDSDLVSEPSWGVLCDFLGTSVPQSKFPQGKRRIHE